MAADFDAFFASRRQALLRLIGEAMGRETARAGTAPGQEDPVDFEIEPDEDRDRVA